MKKSLIIASILILTLVSYAFIPSCSFGKEKSDVAVFYYDKNDTHLKDVRTQMDMAFNNLKMTYRNYDSKGDQKKQNKDIDKAIADGVGAIAVNIVSAGDYDATKEIVEKAQKADIPLIFFGREVNKEAACDYEKCAFVTSDGETAGKMQGELIGAYILSHKDTVDLNGDGKISYLAVRENDGDADGEKKSVSSIGAANEFLKENGLDILIPFGNGEVHITAKEAKDKLKEIIFTKTDNMPEIIIGTCDEMAIEALMTLQEHGYNKSGGKTIPIFGIDGSEAAEEKIKSGAITGTVKKDSETMAQTIVQIIKNSTMGANKFTGIDKSMLKDDWKINIPYTPFVGKDN